MNLHEYQSKNLLAEYALPVPGGRVAHTPDEAIAVAKSLPSKRFVVKAQVHAGGRGKAGGVVLVDSPEAAGKESKRLLGTRLVTYQTDSHGQPVNAILIEPATDIARELYISALVDRSQRKLTFIVSSEGGVDIEKVAEKTPEKIHKLAIDPLFGLMPYQARELGFKLDLNPEQVKQFTVILTGLYNLFVDKDLSLIEINPLVVTTAGNLVCLDAKLTVDDNAMFRQPAVADLRDRTQEDERENRAQQWDLNYIALEGNIGCMVNGAGLAMATMDLIKLSGGQPANFLDVGGGATEERVTEAFKIILSDTQVKGVLINIFGGIVRCDLIADGILAAVKQVNVQIPVVVRLEGNNAELGIKKLNEAAKTSDFKILAAENLKSAAEKVVAAVKGV